MSCISLSITTTSKNEDTIDQDIRTTTINNGLITRIQHKFELSYLPQRPPVNIEFQDITYSVPNGRKGTKIILRNISGSFRSGELTAILGPSGAGKSTLLNLLAGYKCRDASGQILINGVTRNLRQFRKLSRYIMQEDLLQPLLTVQEMMLVAANLKLGTELSQENKLKAINEILDMLRLSNAKNTTTTQLSGGEKKRLSIALELLNNPPVLFLDEPTTGLDDLSSSQCIALLKLLAQGGRTVICSIHTPSAKIFEQFDNVYVVAAGQCIFQGVGRNIVPFMAKIGLECPKHYNPADFIIEVSTGEYGELHDKMVQEVDNGRVFRWRSANSTNKDEELIDSKQFNLCTLDEAENIICEPLPIEDIKNHNYKYHTTSWRQFKILLSRMLLQTWRDSNYLMLKAGMYLFLALIIGSLFWQMGNDGSKTLFNFGFCFTCIIVFLYVPLLPILLHFPMEVQLLKREHFNKWYGLNAYFCAMTVAQLPSQIILGSLYIFTVYFLTDQPPELNRLLMFYITCILTALISESMGLVISSQLNILNGMFVGPASSVPLMLLAVYGLGTGSNGIPIIIRFAMSFSFLRYGLEGIIIAIYGGDRANLPCPDEEEYCQYRNPKHLMEIMGMENVEFWSNFIILTFCFVLFRVTSLYLLRQRLRPNKTFQMLNYIGKIVKSHFNLSHK